VAAVSGTLSVASLGVNRVALTSHVCELLAAALKIVAVLGLNGILDGTRHGVVGAEDGALDELDLARHAALEAACGSNGTAGLLALSPCGRRARLAARIGRGCALWGTKLVGWVVAGRSGVDLGAIVALAGVLCRAVAHIRLRQAVGRVWAVVGLAVERVLVSARGVLVEERAADFVLVLAAVVLLQTLVFSRVCRWRRHQGLAYAGVRLPVGLGVWNVVVVRHGQRSGAGSRMAAASNTVEGGLLMSRDGIGA
jgi:hypothetical protein